MTDQDQSDADDAAFEAAFDDGSTDWVRDLLATARVTEPVPTDVAARLDDTLARLKSERLESGDARQPAAVVPLRRRAAPFLAAAAVVAVIGGVAIGQILHGGSGGSANTASSDAAGGSSEEQSSAIPRSPQDTARAQAPEGRKYSSHALPELTSGTFPADAARVMQGLSDRAPTPAAGSPSADDLDQAGSPKSALTAPPVVATPGLLPLQPSCPGPDAPGAVVVPATLDGRPVALVFRAPSAAAQEVEAWSCDGGTELAAASVAH